MHKFWYDYVKPKYGAKANVYGFYVYGYRQFHCIHKTKLYLERHRRRC